MTIYKVGGCVRDALLGLMPKDIDYVVVGSTPAEMLADGYEQVGASFPVFLKNGEEYALARTERKVGVGYHGFETNFDSTVTLEDDLIRRDLTINAMAQNMETGEIIDPYGGQRDLEQRVLRHTSSAFAEDPVRVLRTARFAARYNFTIAADTVGLMRKVAPELMHVPAERIWAEFEKGLSERNPARMFEALEYCDAMWTPTLAPYRGWASEMRVHGHLPLYVRFTMAARGFSAKDYKVCKIPTKLAHTSTMFNLYLKGLARYTTFLPGDRLDLLMSFKALNDMQLISEVMDVCKFWVDPTDWKRINDAIHTDIHRCKSVDAAAIAAANPNRVRDAIAEARVLAML